MGKLRAQKCTPFFATASNQNEKRHNARYYDKVRGRKKLGI